MRVAGFGEPGGPDVLRPMEIATPEAGPGEVRVRVRAAGVQPFDLAVREGWTPPGTPEGFPRVPGNEFAGTVDQAGDGVADFRPGDEVMGNCRLNAYAEYVVVPAAAVTAKPASMPWEVAGAFPAAVMTPHIALEEMGVGAGDTLLVHAAAGGVGAVAVQLARIAGATVVGTASEANHDYLRSLGAIPVAYGDGLEERIRDAAPGGVDAALASTRLKAGLLADANAEHDTGRLVPADRAHPIAYAVRGGEIVDLRLDRDTEGGQQNLGPGLEQRRLVATWDLPVVGFRLHHALHYLLNEVYMGAHIDGGKASAGRFYGGEI